jgi:hypothetical protein
MMMVAVGGLRILQNVFFLPSARERNGDAILSSNNRRRWRHDDDDDNSLHEKGREEQTMRGALAVRGWPRARHEKRCTATTTKSMMGRTKEK